MASAHILKTEDGLSAYLTSLSIPHTSVSLLTGGTANYVYRVTFPDGSTSIYKHAAPHLRTNELFRFDPSRMNYEDRILELLPPLLNSQLPDSPVHTVNVHSYDKERKLLCLSDGGSRHLKDAYADPALDISSIGAALGRWLATLHASTVATPLSIDPTSQDMEENNAIAVSIYRYAYDNLVSAFAEVGDDAVHMHGNGDSVSNSNPDNKFAYHINDAYGSRLATDNECICHGDFWPGNVLVAPSAEGNGEAVLTVVDWEMTRRGTSATDTAQFLAESFLLDRFRSPSLGLAPTFLNAYLDARGTRLDVEWFRRLAIHWAVHVTFWPTRVPWTDGAGKEALVKLGKSVLRAADEGKWDELFGLPVFMGMEERFRPEL